MKYVCNECNEFVKFKDAIYADLYDPEYYHEKCYLKARDRFLRN